MTYFRHNTPTPFLPYDFYNLYATFRRETQHGLSSTDILIENLKEQGIHYRIQPVGNRTEHLFIALPRSIQLALENQEVLMFDSTYKTNRFGLPLLHAIGK